jgi:hypothetical protein
MQRAKRARSPSPAARDARVAAWAAALEGGEAEEEGAAAALAALREAEALDDDADAAALAPALLRCAQARVSEALACGALEALREARARRGSGDDALARALCAGAGLRALRHLARAYDASDATPSATALLARLRLHHAPALARACHFRSETCDSEEPLATRSSDDAEGMPALLCLLRDACAPACARAAACRALGTRVALRRDAWAAALHGGGVEALTVLLAPPTPTTTHGAALADEAAHALAELLAEAPYYADTFSGLRACYEAAWRRDGGAALGAAPAAAASRAADVAAARRRAAAAGALPRLVAALARGGDGAAHALLCAATQFDVPASCTADAAANKAALLDAAAIPALLARVRDPAAPPLCVAAAASAVWWVARQPAADERPPHLFHPAALAQARAAHVGTALLHALRHCRAGGALATVASIFESAPQQSAAVCCGGVKDAVETRGDVCITDALAAWLPLLAPPLLNYSAAGSVLLLLAQLLRARCVSAPAAALCAGGAAGALATLTACAAAATRRDDVLRALCGRAFGACLARGLGYTERAARAQLRRVPREAWALYVTLWTCERGCSKTDADEDADARLFRREGHTPFLRVTLCATPRGLAGALALSRPPSAAAAWRDVLSWVLATSPEAALFDPCFRAMLRDDGSGEDGALLRAAATSASGRALLAAPPRGRELAAATALALLAAEEGRGGACAAALGAHGGRAARVLVAATLHAAAAAAHDDPDADASPESFDALAHALAAAASVAFGAALHRQPRVAVSAPAESGGAGAGRVRLPAAAWCAAAAARSSRVRRRVLRRRWRVRARARRRRARRVRPAGAHPGRRRRRCRQLWRRRCADAMHRAAVRVRRAACAPRGALFSRARARHRSARTRRRRSSRLGVSGR